MSNEAEIEPSMVANRIAGRVHVWSPNMLVLREGWKAFNAEAKVDPQYRDDRKAFYRELLVAHKNNQDLVRAFRL